MTRRKWILGLFLPLPAASMPDPDLHAHIVAFERAWFPFLKSLYGCTGDQITQAACRPAQGRMDLRLWKQARDRAIKLFDLSLPPP